MASATSAHELYRGQPLTIQEQVLHKNPNQNDCKLSTKFKTKSTMNQSRRRQLKLFSTIAIIFVTTLYLPRPKWLTCYPKILPEPLQYPEKLFSSGATILPEIIDPNVRGAIRMFNIYNETQSEIRNTYHRYKLSRQEIGENVPEVKAKLRILPSTIQKLPIHLQLMSTRDREYLYGRQGRQLDNHTYSSRQQPECVDFVGPQEMRAPKICIHPPETDKVISMFLRSSGHWELDHVIDMEWAMQANTDMQLVDLGCNIGVFTLYAAGMGRHVVAVDVLPSNLRLLQTSLTLNDLENRNYVIRPNTSTLYPKRIVAKIYPTTRPLTRNIAKDNEEDKNQHDIPNKDFGLESKFKMDLNGLFNNKEALQKTKRKRRGRKSRALLELKSYHLTTREAIPRNKILLPVKRGSKIANDDLRRSTRSNVTEIPDLHKLTFSSSSPRNMFTNVTPSETFRISQLVTIVHNAIYSDRTTRLGVHLQADGNVGGSDVLREDSPLLDEQRKSQSLVLVDTICLDDLLPLVKAPSVYLKMDIEGSEPQALECAQKFFEKVRVRYVLMEWLFQLRAVGSSHSSAPAMIQFLTAKGLIPTRGTGVDVRGGAGDNRGVLVLDVNAWDKWPEMVLWMER